MESTCIRTLIVNRHALSHNSSFRQPLIDPLDRCSDSVFLVLRTCTSWLPLGLVHCNLAVQIDPFGHARYLHRRCVESLDARCCLCNEIISRGVFLFPLLFIAFLSCLVSLPFS